MKIFDDSHSLPRPISRIKDYGNYLDGVVVTEHGIVDVYSEDWNSRLDFACDGILHIRHFPEKGYTARGLVTVARKFAKEIYDRYY